MQLYSITHHALLNYSSTLTHTHNDDKIQ